MALRPTNWLLGGFLFSACLVACSAADGDPPLPNGTGGTPSTATGGAPTGTTGGFTATTGGFTATTGGVPNSGTGGATGGISNGTTGGAPQGKGGGMSTGGASGGSAGKASGGNQSTGGSAGKATGGTSGGSKATGGASTGGATGGAKATGGSGTGGATNTGAGPTAACGCLKSAGEFGSNPIGTTIVVDGGEVYDGKCMTFRASNALGDGTQTEGQKPIFEIGGGTIQNVIIGNSAADGIHIEEGGNATLKNVHWLDVGEDAMSIGSERAGNPTITIDCGSSAQGSDKTFQVNSPSTWNFRNFTAKTAGKFMRQNGSSTFKMTLTLDHCDVADMSESIYRTDSTSSIVNMTNTRYHNIGDSLFIFGSTNVSADTHNQVGTFSGNVSY